MIIGKMLSDEITANWEAIKFAVITVNDVNNNIEEYCINLLASLFSGKCQCWIGVSDDRSTIKGIAITRVNKDIGGVNFLLIDTLYVYDTTELRDRLLFVKTIKNFGEQYGCSSALFYTSNPGIISIADKIGFKESSRVYTMVLGG